MFYQVAQTDMIKPALPHSEMITSVEHIPDSITFRWEMLMLRDPMKGPKLKAWLNGPVGSRPQGYNPVLCLNHGLIVSFLTWQRPLHCSILILHFFFPRDIELKFLASNLKMTQRAPFINKQISFPFS